MAVQTHKGQRPAQINRTPAPKLDLKNGGLDYGEAQDISTPSSVAPSVTVQSKLAQNLRESVDDDGVLAQVIAQGVAGHADNVPADDNTQQRKVDATAYPAAHGLTRQQADYADIGKNSLPKTLGASAAADPRTDQYGGVKS
jgi:hypothetical protein